MGATGTPSMFYTEISLANCRLGTVRNNTSFSSSMFYTVIGLALSRLGTVRNNTSFSSSMFYTVIGLALSRLGTARNNTYLTYPMCLTVLSSWNCPLIAALLLTVFNTSTRTALSLRRNTTGA